MDFAVKSLKETGAALYHAARNMDQPGLQTFLMFAAVSTIPAVAGQNDTPEPTFWQSNLFIGITTGAAATWLLCNVGAGYYLAKCCAKSAAANVSQHDELYGSESEVG